MRHPYHQRGFTLVELIMVIVLMGVIGGMVSVFMKSPIDAYVDSGRRAALNDVADTTARRISRDLHKALPNSIRISADYQCLEFIPTKTGARYRASGPGALDFANAVSSFNMLGNNNSLPADQKIVKNDVIVVYNLGSGQTDAYSLPSDPLNNTSVVRADPVGASETPILIESAGKLFPLESGGNRFHVIPGNEKIVSFICSGGKLYRNANYAYSPSCPAPTLNVTPVLATGVTCNFAYDPNQQRNALVAMSLTFTDSTSGESVSLYHEVHVDNTP